MYNQQAEKKMNTIFIFVLFILISWYFRFGHGAFLLCLEDLYKKITGKDLIYTALVGKPSELTYVYAHQLILDQAREIGIAQKLKRLYAIG